MPQPKTILVHADLTEMGIALLEEAAAFTAARGSHLVALVVGLQPIQSYVPFPDIPLDSFFEETVAARAAVQAEVERVDQRLERTGVSREVRGVVVPTSEAGPVIARQARYADLSIITRVTDLNWHRLVDAALFESGKPVLMCPPGASLAKGFNRVVIGWDTSPEAARAVSAALDIAPDAELHVVAVDPRIGPEAHGEEPGATLATALARHGAKVTVDAIPRGDGSVVDALLRHAEAIGADLLVAGAYGHSRLGEILLGGSTRDLLRKTELPLLLAH